jgi:dihydrofolate synthase / folylpolyglutamate synthase
MKRAAEIKNHLFDLATRGIKYDLARMAEAVNRCGNPQQAYPSFHVAGTNGKGSVCAYLESALRHCGIRTGLFTSPHLVDFEERFMINGRPIAESIWLRVYDDLQPVIEDFAFTFFEATALLAFEIFKREKVEWAVFETGLGGRLDATNVVVPRVAVITRLAMDHREFLGDTLASIAGEKLGIVKRGVPLVMAKPDIPDVADLAIRRCTDNDSPCTFVDDVSVSRAVDLDGVSFTWDNLQFRANLRGGYQVQNAIVALNALKAAGFESGSSIKEGVRAARLPGRFQVECIRGKTVVFDVGHNPNAAENFCSAFCERFTEKNVCMVLGIMKDKDFAGMLPHYARIARHLLLAAPATVRAAQPESLHAALPKDFSGACSIAPSIAEAISLAMSGPEEIVCAAGSFYTVGEAMTALGMRPYA